MAIGDQTMDIDYRDEARRARMDPMDFAVLYCFAMFQRGIAYAARTPRATVIFHMLRDGAAVTREDEVTATVAGPYEVQWGNILDACLSEGLFPHDDAWFADLLRSFRATVQADAEFQSIMGKFTLEMTPELLHSLTREAVLRVFSEARVTPAVRDSNARGRLVAILDAAKQSSKGVSAFLF